ncbi:MAG: DUF1854 domain-containing protein [Planctomycetes bacterium]|nr:DUF1854 domain-containing protein [Planctomycetota bacterium]MBM4059413.1 DUF1854 domain-containing protein [Planctomycetota bacterium]
MHDLTTRSTGPAAAADWRLERRPDGRLDFIDGGGGRHENVDIVRAFPVSSPGGPAAVVTADGGELAWIDAIASVPGPLGALLESELTQREFLPRIVRLESVSAGEPTEWTVVTDRGPRRFKVSHSDEFVTHLDGSAFVTDTHGMRYVIPSVAALDARSRRLLEQQG